MRNPGGGETEAISQMTDSHVPHLIKAPDKAQGLGITILSEDEFTQLLNKSQGE